MVNIDLKQKILSRKKTDEEDEIFYITSELCIDEGNTDFQLWERYRPPHKVNIKIKPKFGGTIQLYFYIDFFESLYIYRYYYFCRLERRPD